MEEVFYDLYQGLPRQGPGNDRSTVRAIKLVGQLPDQPMILDLGCGTGFQTFQLAHQLGGKIYALDNYPPYLAQVEENAKKQGLDQVIEPVIGDMGNLNFPAAYFDLIWAEGSIYIMGFKDGLKYIKPFLKLDGYVAVSEICWLKNDQPDELVDFWNQEYSSMNTTEGNIEIIRKLNYTLIDYFILSPTAWWDSYYIPLENRLIEMREKYLENESALELIEFVQLEIDMYRKYPDFYGYVFFIMRKD